jgi:hypothetical protein
MRRLAAFALLVFFSFMFAAATACELPPSCPYVDVADTVAIMGMNSHGVRDTLALSITHKRVCE